MSVKVEVNHPAFDKKTPMAINYLGVVDNGGSATFTDEQVAQFEAATGQSVSDAFEGSDVVTVSGAGKSKGGDS